jgi:hypothetical protein
MPATGAFTSVLHEYIDRSMILEARAIRDVQSMSSLCGVRSVRTISDGEIAFDVFLDAVIPYGEVVYEDGR